MAPVYKGSSIGLTFNRSAARNFAAGEAIRQENPQVLFFADGDTVVSQEQFWSACYFAQTYNRLVLAFSDYVRLDRRASLAFPINQPPTRGTSSWPHHASGAIAVPAALWNVIGGYDERFVSWGGEDRAFFCACNTARGFVDAPRITGPAYHLWHPPSPEKSTRLPSYKRNVALGSRYKNAAGWSKEMGILPATPSNVPNQEEMFSILTELGGPLDSRSTSVGCACGQEERDEKGAR